MYIHSFLISSTDIIGQLQAPALYLRGKNPSYLLDRNQIDRKSGQDCWRRVKVYGARGNQTPDCPNRRPVTTDKIIKLVLYVTGLRLGNLPASSCRHDNETSGSITLGELVSAQFGYSFTHYQKNTNVLIKQGRTNFSRNLGDITKLQLLMS